MGRRTITGMLCACGRERQDWSAAYRIFEKEKFDSNILWGVIRKSAVSNLSNSMPIVVAMDDTLIHKTGRKVSGASWRRDPLGPKFRPNFIHSQRFLQISMMLPENGMLSGARAIPVDLIHAPTPTKPKSKDNTEVWGQYNKDCKVNRINVRGRERLEKLRNDLDEQPDTENRTLVVAVDGGYTNREIFRNIPDRTHIIGRIRKDAKLFQPPPIRVEGTQGRKRSYGPQICTPYELLHDDNVSWVQVTAFGAGKEHVFDVKTIQHVRWKSAGPKDMRLVVVRPLAYRPAKNKKPLYRDPGFLLCSDPDMPLDQLLQAYLWRWETEVAFREEKTLMGMGEAQVRTQKAVETAPQFIAAGYSLLHLAAANSGIESSGFIKPKWRNKKSTDRCTSSELIQRFRAELWGQSLGIHFDGFMVEEAGTRSLQNSPSPVASAVLNAFR